MRHSSVGSGLGAGLGREVCVQPVAFGRDVWVEDDGFTVEVVLEDFAVGAREIEGCLEVEEL